MTAPVKERLLDRIAAVATGGGSSGRRVPLVTVKSAGSFRIYKAEPHRPHREHPTFECAQAEAKRLAELSPSDTFVIAQEVGRVSARRSAR